MCRKLIVAAAIAATAAAGAVPAIADTAQPRVVSDNPVDVTPQVQDGTVDALALVGHTVVVGGTFTVVADAGETTRYPRRSLFAYDLTTGAVSGFAPTLNGTVTSLTAGPGNTVYVGGTFTTVDGSAQRGVTQLDLGTGQRVVGFTASINDDDVRALAYAGGWLYLGGAFRHVDGQQRLGLARVNPATGALEAFDLHLTAPDFPTRKVLDLAVSGTRLVAIGVIEYAAGWRRPQLVMADTTGSGSLADWYTDTYDNNCYDAFDTYLRGVDF